MAALKPEITDYIGLVDFLSAYYQWRKSIDAQFSFSTWQEEMGLGSRTLLRLILSRKRRISPKTATVMRNHLRLNSHEADYFDLLLAYSQAKTQTERKSIGLSLTKAQRKKYNPISLGSDLIDTDILKPVVLSLMTYKDMIFTKETLSDILNVSIEKISETLDTLVHTQIISKDHQGAYSFAPEGYKVPEALGNEKLKAFYRYWLEQAKEALEWPLESRRFRALHFALSPEEFIEVQNQFNELAGQLLGNYKSTSLNGRRLYLLESVLMPISNEYRSDEDKY